MVGTYRAKYRRLVCWRSRSNSTVVEMSTFLTGFRRASNELPVLQVQRAYVLHHHEGTRGNQYRQCHGMLIRYRWLGQNFAPARCFGCLGFARIPQSATAAELYYLCNSNAVFNIDMEYRQADMSMAKTKSPCGADRLRRCPQTGCAYEYTDK